MIAGMEFWGQHLKVSFHGFARFRLEGYGFEAVVAHARTVQILKASLHIGAIRQLRLSPLSKHDLLITNSASVSMPVKM
jgi:hypothetical protein